MISSYFLNFNDYFLQDNLTGVSLPISIGVLLIRVWDENAVVFDVRDTFVLILLVVAEVA